MWREKLAELVYVVHSSRLLRPWNDSGHWVITDISLLLECIFPSIKIFHFPLLAPSFELDGFRHLSASVGFIWLLDLHSQWKTINDFDLENTSVNKEKTKQKRLLTESRHQTAVNDGDANATRGFLAAPLRGAVLVLERTRCCAARACWRTVVAFCSVTWGCSFSGHRHRQRRCLRWPRWTVKLRKAARQASLSPTTITR